MFTFKKVRALLFSVLLVSLNLLPSITQSRTFCERENLPNRNGSTSSALIQSSTPCVPTCGSVLRHVWWILCSPRKSDSYYVCQRETNGRVLHRRHRLEWNPQVDPARAIRELLTQEGYGALKVSEVWRGYATRHRQRVLSCSRSRHPHVAAPTARTHAEAKLNTTITRRLPG